MKILIFPIESQGQKQIGIRTEIFSLDALDNG